MDRNVSIGIIGAGRVAGQLSRALHEAGYPIAWVWSRTASSASQLALRLSCNALSLPQTNLPPADLIILSIPDDAVANTAARLTLDDPLTPIVHTSGTLDADSLNPHQHRGIFYPMQTFSENRNVSFRNIPLCIEANEPALLNTLEALARALSSTPVLTHGQQRSILHIAAVFSCNFSNYLFSVAEDILDNNGLSFEMMHPLMQETVRKACEFKPSSVQTGPASRGDRTILEKHLRWLEGKPEYHEVYALLSELIRKKHAGNEEL